jgi:hypothetical protein
MHISNEDHRFWNLYLLAKLPTGSNAASQKKVIVSFFRFWLLLLSFR